MVYYLPLRRDYSFYSTCSLCITITPYSMLTYRVVGRTRKRRPWRPYVHRILCPSELEVIKDVSREVSETHLDHNCQIDHEIVFAEEIELGKGIVGVEGFLKFIVIGWSWESWLVPNGLWPYNMCARRKKTRPHNPTEITAKHDK